MQLVPLFGHLTEEELKLIIQKSIITKDNNSQQLNNLVSKYQQLKTKSAV